MPMWISACAYVRLRQSVRGCVATAQELYICNAVEDALCAHNSSVDKCDSTLVPQSARCIVDTYDPLLLCQIMHVFSWNIL